MLILQQHSPPSDWGNGSLSTLQRFANQFNEAYVKIKLSEIDKKRVPNETIEQIIHDLTDVCIKVEQKKMILRLIL